MVTRTGKRSVEAAGEDRSASPKFKVALLGPLEIVGPKGAVALGGKVAGLLSFLAHAAPQPQTRERLSALLWGSHFDTQARQNLRQTLVTLRRVLGDDAFISNDDAVALQPAMVACDVGRFLSLIRDGSRAALAEAIDLYRGPFLADTAIAEEAWSDWATNERQRLESLALDAMVRLGEQELAQGSSDRALEIGRRATAVDNLREDCHRLVLRALAAMGRRTEALKHYQQFRDVLERELDVEPDAETQALASEFRKSPSPTERNRVPQSSAGSDVQTPPGPLPDRPSIAVLPFTNLSGDPSQGYFSDGISEDIITELSRFSELLVIARNSSFKYRQETVDVGQLRRELGVRYVLGGSVRRSGERIRVTTQLVDASTGACRWAERYDCDLKDVFAVQDEVTQTVVALLAAHVNRAELERALLKPPATWQAYDYFMRGSGALNLFLSSFKAQELYEARRLFERSLSIDPNYARAIVGMSFTHSLAWVQALDGDHLKPDALDRAYELARRAVQLDPNLSEGHSHLGNMLRLRGEHESAIAEFERARMLNRNFTDWRFSAVLVCAGQSTRAIEIGKANIRLDPFYPPFASGWFGLAHYMLEKYAEALPSLCECVSRAPNWGAAHAWLAATHAQLGHTDEARTQAAEVLRINPSYTIDGTQKRVCLFKSTGDTEQLNDGLRKAGLPEK